MLREAVHYDAHFHDGAGEAHFFAKNLGAIGRRKDGFADIEPDLAAVDVEGGDDLDVARPVGTDLLVHEPHGGAIDGGAAVEVNSLDERAGTIAHSDDGDTNFSHWEKEILPAAISLEQDAKY